MSRLVRTSLARARVHLVALWKLARHPEAPRAAKWLALGVIAYALSPIDLIPDFIPVLGLLDDIVIVPLGIAAVVWLTPKPLWQQLLREAEASPLALPASRAGAVAIVLVWLVIVAGLVAWWWSTRG